MSASFYRILLGCMLTIATVAWAPAPGAAQEWTRFRGPNGTGVGVAAEVPNQWTDADYNWKIALPGVGHSAPVLWGDKLFITSGMEDSAQRVVMAYNANTGEQLWERRFESEKHKKHLKNSFASSTPAVDAHRVYVTWTTPEEYLLMALDHAGEVQWTVDLGTFASQHSSGASPIVYEDLVILGNEQDGPSSIVAIDGATGEIRWQGPRRTAVVAYCTPCIYTPADGKPQLIFNSQAHGISGVDPKTGKTLWDLEVFNKRSVSSPIVIGDLIYGSCGSGGGGNYTVAVQAPPKGPKEMYRIDDNAPYVASPIAKDDLLFLFGDKGVVQCVDAPTGEVLWKQRVGGAYSGSPVRIGDRLFCVAEDGTVIVIAASDTYQLLGQTPLGEASHSTPAIANGQLYLRTFSHLMSIGGKKQLAAH